MREFRRFLAMKSDGWAEGSDRFVGGAAMSGLVVGLMISLSGAWSCCSMIGCSSDSMGALRV